MHWKKIKEINNSNNNANTNTLGLCLNAHCPVQESKRLEIFRQLLDSSYMYLSANKQRQVTENDRKLT